MVSRQSLRPSISRFSVQPPTGGVLFQHANPAGRTVFINPCCPIGDDPVFRDATATFKFRFGRELKLDQSSFVSRGDDEAKSAVGFLTLHQKKVDRTFIWPLGLQTAKNGSPKECVTGPRIKTAPIDHGVFLHAAGVNSNNDTPFSTGRPSLPHDFGVKP